MENKNIPKHLTQSITLEEAALPHLVKVTVGLITLVMAVFIIWASFTKIEEVASSGGQVVPSGYIQSVQHLEGGIVKSIDIHEGDMVTQGQILLHLDGTDANADLGKMQERKRSLKLQAARLREFAGSDAIDADNAEELTPEHKAILDSMMQARKSQQKVLLDQISQKEKELQALISTREALIKNVSIAQKENKIKQDLAKKGYGSQLSALSAEKELNQIKGKLSEALNQENKAKDAINEAQSRLESLNADLKKQALENLNKVESELAEIIKTLEKYENIANRTVIKSPVRGIVKGLTVNTIGAVIEPGKVLMEIVPVEEDLMLEVLVSPSDVGHIRKGQSVAVKVSAFDFSRYGSVKGTLDNISASTFENEKGQSFYKAKIKLLQNYLGNDPQRNLILPGMTVQADIITGEKTVLQYLLKPIYVTTTGAFREQ